MKKILFSCLVMALAFQVSAIEKAEGYYINEQNESIGGHFILHPAGSFLSYFEVDLKSIQNGIYFIPEGKQASVYLVPYFTEKINFVCQGETFTFVSRINDVRFKTKKTSFKKARHQFYRVIEQGNKLTVLAKYKLTYNRNKKYVLSDEIFAVEYIYFKTILFEPRRRNWKADMLTYFHDCTLLKQKIKDKEYKKDDAREIAIFYNLDCQ
jgi:hypothetical protein